MGAPEELFSHSCTLVKMLKLLLSERLGEVDSYRDKNRERRLQTELDAEISDVMGMLMSPY